MNELVRLVADWLEDGTHGVNVLLASVPRDNPDPLPTSVTVVDETRDNRPARGRSGDDVPQLLVGFAGGSVMRDTVTDAGDVDATIGIRYAARHVDAYVAKRDGFYVLRAVAWSLRKLARSQANDAGRTRNQVTIVTVDGPRFDPWFEQVDDTLIVGSVLLPLTARDHYPI